MKIFKYIIQFLGFLAVVCTLMPLLSYNIWWIRMFDYPLIQFTLFTFLIFILYLIVFSKRSILDYIYLLALLGCFIFQGIKIYPYTFLATKQVGNSALSEKTNLKIFEANVLQKNTDTQALLEQVKKENADLLLFTETDKNWQRAIVQGIDSSYRYSVEVPLNNTYGMLMYSKFKLQNSEVKYRVEGNIPSINTEIILPGGHLVVLYAIHPTPPDPQHKSSSSDRGTAMMKTALLLMDAKSPVLVLGDFNEVAWSQNVTLFQRISSLLDVRVGRGLYNTFDAKSTFMRWPLDQVFVSEHFRLKELHVGGYTGSDHFPFVTTLTFEPQRAAEQKPAPMNKKLVKLIKKYVGEQEKE